MDIKYYLEHCKNTYFYIIDGKRCYQVCDVVYDDVLKMGDLVIDKIVCCADTKTNINNTKIEIIPYCKMYLKKG